MERGKGSRYLVVGLAVLSVVAWLASECLFDGGGGVIGTIGVETVPFRLPLGLQQGKVARIDITGPILASQEVIDQVRKHERDAGVKAILLRIDSPGGAVAPSQEIHAELLRVRRAGAKKVVASIGSLGTSGGYYIAAAAERIWADPGSLVGSIGVIMELTKFGDLLRKIGVDAEVIKSGPYKDLASPLRKTTPEERLLLQGIIDDTHRQFIEAVADGRGMPVEDVVPLADGRVFTGAQAHGLRLVDELGGLEEALRDAARLAGIKGEPRVIRPPKGWRLRRLLEDVESSIRARLGMTASPLGPLYLWKP